MSLADPDDEPDYWLDSIVNEYLNTVGFRNAHAREVRRLFSLIQAVAMCSKPEEVIKMAAAIEEYLASGRKGPPTVTLVPKPSS